jgi:hypothetical protein
MSAYCHEHEDWDDCADQRWQQRQRDADIGDPATLCYPDDRYPYVVTAVTPTTITLERVWVDALDVDNSENGAVRGGWPLNDKSSTKQYLPRETPGKSIKAHWSEKRKTWYVASTTPVVVGYARYLRDWSL